MRDNTIDIGKFIASILVILIHLPLFYNNGTIIWQFDTVFRLAVPFFAVCSGYYLGKSLETVKGNVLASKSNSKNFKVFLRKICSIYIMWSLLYLIVYIPSWIESGWFSLFAFVDWGIAAILQGSYFHLWYILYMIYAVIVLSLIVKVVPMNKFPLIIIVLYIIEVVQYGYRLLLPETVQTALSVFDQIDCLSAITRVLPILMLGMYISNMKPQHEKKGVYFIGFLVSFVCLVIERNFLVCCGGERVSYILFTLPTIYFLFRLLIESEVKVKQCNTKLLSQMSTYIYLIHPIYIILVDNILAASDVVNCISVIALSVISSYIIVLCKDVIRHRRLNKAC